MSATAPVHRHGSHRSSRRHRLAVASRAFAALFMLVALVSGIVTHRRFSKDLLLLRLGPDGRRPWLDFHNVTAMVCAKSLRKERRHDLAVARVELHRHRLACRHDGDPSETLTGPARSLHTRGWFWPIIVLMLPTITT